MSNNQKENYKLKAHIGPQSRNKHKYGKINVKERTQMNVRSMKGREGRTEEESSKSGKRTTFRKCSQRKRDAKKTNKQRKKIKRNEQELENRRERKRKIKEKERETKMFGATKRTESSTFIIILLMKKLNGKLLCACVSVSACERFYGGGGGAKIIYCIDVTDFSNERQKVKFGSACLPNVQHFFRWSISRININTRQFHSTSV